MPQVCDINCAGCCLVGGDTNEAWLEFYIENDAVSLSLHDWPGSAYSWQRGADGVVVISISV